MVLVFYCNRIGCLHKFAVNVALVRQFSTIKSKIALGTGCNYFENMAENVHICFEVHIKK